MLKTGDASLFLDDGAGEILANSLDLIKWRFKLPKNVSTIAHEGLTYYWLKDFPDLTYSVDKKEMEINISAPAYRFDPNVIELRDLSFVTPMEPSLGTYFNYDLLGQKSNHFTALGGLFSANLFSKYGTGFSDFLAQHENGYNHKWENGNERKHKHRHHWKKDKVLRLNTNWRYDQPEDMETLILGDSYTVPGLWGNSVGMGGILWGTNFRTQPSFIPYPLPSAKGIAISPSTVDLYLNNNLIGKHSTYPGPFSINAIPATTGAGTVNLVTTDLLGREQTVSIPFYVATTLLTPGLQKYDYSLGFLRQDYGIKSNDYRNLAFSGNHLIGVTNNLTLEAHVEFLKKQQAAGIGANYLLSTLGVFSLAGAISHNSYKYHHDKYRHKNHDIQYKNTVDILHKRKLNKTGSLISLGFQRQSYQDVNFGVNVQKFSKTFVQLGSFVGRAPRHQLTAFLGLNLYDGTSFSAGYIKQNNRHYPDLNLVNLTFNQTLPYNLFLNISALSNVKNRRNQAVFLTITYSVNDNTTLNVMGNGQRRANQGAVQLTQNLPKGPGYGYNLYAAAGQQNNYQGTFLAQNDIGTYSVGAAKQGEAILGQAQASGAVVFLNKNLYLSRKIYQSLAVVEVPGFSNVEVYSQNQIIGKTDSDGTVLVPELIPYQNNPIRVELSNLPIDVEVGKEEINIIPYYRSGLVVKFPIKLAAGATMKLLLPSGSPVPIEAVVKKKSEEVPVGRDGEVYISNLEDYNELIVQVNDESYKCNFTYNKSEDPLPDLGTIQCQK